MSESEARPLERRRILLGCAIFAVIGAVAMMYFNAFELTSRSKYHRDLTQSPHWVAYHGDAFAEDDLLVEYATFNETLVQNAIYWVGTWLIDVVVLNKMVGIVLFGLTAALFFWLVTLMSGPRAGVLAASFFVIFPRSTYEIAGGFSKAWAIGFVLLAVYVVERRNWRILVWLMPLAAVTYPVAPVLIGAIVLAGLVLEYPRNAKEAIRGVRYLAAGSALALIPLLYKYFTPPEWIGNMIPASVFKARWESGIALERTLPLWEEVLSYLEHPLFILGPILIFMLLSQRGLVWKRSWTALVIASVVCYVAADLVVPRLYLPDRYTRYSIAVLLILWHAHNWARVLELSNRRWVRQAALAALVVVAAVSFRDTFRPCDGDRAQGVWEDREQLAGVSHAIASLPLPVFVAGHPEDTACVMIQSRRPVLAINRMYHHWFDKFRQTLDGRHKDIFRALYARNVDQVNQLFTSYGVTHLVVHKSSFRSSKLRSGSVYKREYKNFIRDLTKGQADFLLNPPPRDAVVFEDKHFWLVQLPLPVPGAPGGEPTSAVPGPS